MKRMRNLFFLLSFLVVSAAAFGQISSLPYSQDFESGFTTGLNVNFLPNWNGNEVRGLDSVRIAQYSKRVAGGIRSLSAVPTSTFTPTIVVSLNLTGYSNVQFKFWGASDTNISPVGSNRNCTIKISTSTNGGTTYSAPTSIGDSTAFANVSGIPFQQFTYNLPASANNQANVRLKIEIGRGNGTGSAARFVMDNATIETTANDVTPPTATYAKPISASQVRVAFSESVGTSAEVTTNYTGLAVSNAARNASQDTVTLTLATPLSYVSANTLTISNIADLAGNTMTAPQNYNLTADNALNKVQITEIMYNDPSSSDSLEFIEVYNASSQTAYLNGCSISDGFNYTFQIADSLLPNTALVIAKNLGAFTSFFGSAPGKSVQWNSGSLINTGEPITMKDNYDSTVFTVTYGVTAPWDTLANGKGSSLNRCNTASPTNIPSSWTGATTNLTQYGIINGKTVYATPGSLCSTTTSSCSSIGNYTNDDTLSIYYAGSASNGYLAGHNSFQDKAKVDKFSLASPYTIGSVLFGVGVAKSNSPATNFVTLKIWDDDGVNGTPGTVLFQQNITYQTLIANVAGNQASFVILPTPLTVSGSVYAGLEFTYVAGDTVALYTNRFGNTPAPGTAWEQWNTNNWYEYSDATNSWGVNVSHYIFLNPVRPIASFTAANTTICAGNSVTYTNNSIQASSYSWSFPGGTPATSASPNPTVTYSTAGTYSATLISIGTCGNDTLVQTNYVTVNATATPTVSGTSTVCAGSTLSLAATTTTPGAIYSWSGPNGFTANSAAISIPNVSNLNAGTYSVVAIAGGCTSATKTQTVTVNSATTPTISGNTTHCEGGTLTLVASGNPGSFLWIGPNGFTANGASISIPNLNSSNAGVYEVVLVVAACTSSTASITINIIPKPTASFTTVADTFYLPNVVVDFTNTSTGSNNSYLWSFGNGNTSNAVNPQATYTAEGSYTVRLVATSNNCSDTATHTIVVLQTTASQTLVNSFHPSVYPNPASNQIVITWRSQNTATTTLRLVDLHGKTVWAQEATYPAGKSTVQIPAETLAEGVYWISINSGQESWTTQIQVKH